jgi:hypothetical protein
MSQVNKGIVARSGPNDMRAQAEVSSARLTDTPTQIPISRNCILRGRPPLGPPERARGKYGARRCHWSSIKSVGYGFGSYPQV